MIITIIILIEIVTIIVNTDTSTNSNPCFSPTPGRLHARYAPLRLSQVSRKMSHPSGMDEGVLDAWSSRHGGIATNTWAE